MNGWICIHRQVQEHWIWKDPCKFQWWVDILLTVNTVEAKIPIGNEILLCKRGESLLSIQSWASRWKVSKDTARNFFTLLERHNMILRVNLGKTTRLTVCNYDNYQYDLHVKKRDAVRQHDTNNKEEDISNYLDRLNNTSKPLREDGFVAPTLDEVIKYFADNYYSENSAIAAWEYYEDLNWHDKNGLAVSSWKMKCRTNWFKDKDKIEKPSVEEINKAKHTDKVKKLYFKNGKYSYNGVVTDNFDKFLYTLYSEYDIDLYRNLK